MIAFRCPTCGKPLKVKDELAGRRGTCPGCQTKCLVPMESEGIAALPPLPAVIVPKPSDVIPVEAAEPRPSSLAKLRQFSASARDATGKVARGTTARLKTWHAARTARADELAAVRDQARRDAEYELEYRRRMAPQQQQPIIIMAGQPQQNITQTVVVHGPAPGNGVATFAFVLAIMSMAFCWVPFLGLLTIPGSVVTFVVALGALLLSIGRKGSGAILAGVSMGLAALAITVTLASTAATANAMNDALKAAVQEPAAAETP